MLGGERSDAPPLRLLQLPAEACAIAIRGNDSVFTGDEDRGSLKLRYPADPPIAFGYVTPAQVIDSDAGHIHSVTILEHVLQVLNSEVAPRNALLRVPREEQ